jgi:hypothetical protein
MMLCCGMAVKRMEMLGVRVWKMKAPNVSDGDSNTDW